MSAPLRLAAFVAVLLAVFAAAALAGEAVGPEPRADRPHAEEEEGHGAEAGAHAASPEEAAPAGLAVAADGLRLVVERRRFAPGTRELRFRLLDDAGRPVTDFDVSHTKRLHLIVVRRDGTRFVHQHPAMAADGTWTARVRLPEAGTYRLFADVTRDGRQQTLGADLFVTGRFTPRALPAPADEAVSDGGLRVRLEAGALRAGAVGPVAFRVADADGPVDDELEPHLGARGHLVALREDDLAYLHTHPEGDALRFATTWPSAGRYRLWVQFRHGGRVHTAAFTQEVAP